MMKLVSANVPAALLNATRDTLVAIGVKGMMVSAAVVRSHEAADGDADGMRPRKLDDALELLIETVIDNALVGDVVEAIFAVCSDVATGDVSLRISDVLCGVRIRNGESIIEG
jgi:nitrogen regulatory protein PII